MTLQFRILPVNMSPIQQLLLVVLEIIITVTSMMGQEMLDQMYIVSVRIFIRLSYPNTLHEIGFC